MTFKAERIRDLLETTDMTNQEIAKAVGVLDSYVRVVQQRLIAPFGKSSSVADINWKARNLERWTERNRARSLRNGQAYRQRKKAARATQASA